MKTKLKLAALALALSTISYQPSTCSAASTINATNHYAWDANTGWIDFRAERPNAGDGFHFGEFSCSGYLWSPNIGWINCGNGSPGDGVSYGNNDNTDFGVNHYGTGDLYGLAWSPNIGWINFGWWVLTPTNTAKPHVDLVTGEFSGYAWSANCGWINLGTSQLKTDRMEIVDTDGDGISDVFEIGYTGSLTNMTASTDADGDGTSDKNEYIFGSNPIGVTAPFKITSFTKTGSNFYDLVWPSSPARIYAIEAKPSLTDTNWIFLGDVGGAYGASSTTQPLNLGVPEAYLRVGAKLPLQP